MPVSFSSHPLPRCSSTRGRQAAVQLRTIRLPGATLAKGRYASELVKDVAPFVESRYRVVADAGGHPKHAAKNDPLPKLQPRRRKSQDLPLIHFMHLRERLVVASIENCVVFEQSVGDRERTGLRRGFGSRYANLPPVRQW